jgi:hypothetical protein
MELAILITSALVKYGPDVAASIQRMFATGQEPTQAEWDVLFAKASKSYDQHIREAELRTGVNQP